MAERRDRQQRELDEVLTLGATWSAVSRVLERSRRGTSISLPQALALLGIAAAPQPLLLSGLAARLVQQPQSVTSLMDRLEHAGWAKRMHDLEDRRAIRVEVTEAGAAKAQEVGAALLAAGQQLLASVDGSVRDRLSAGVVALYEACRAQPGVRLPELPNGDGAIAAPGSEQIA